MTIQEYREITGDTKSTDEKVLHRLDYLSSLCSNVIREELQKHLQGKHR